MHASMVFVPLFAALALAVPKPAATNWANMPGAGFGLSAAIKQAHATPVPIGTAVAAMASAAAKHTKTSAAHKVTSVAAKKVSTTKSAAKAKSTKA
ncbi:hypothetical protein MBLNU459_g7515t1 [Dothideomycetes sp. NU459]